ncbi:MAG: PDZ domain-containing protein [Planctomycetes bacterium]|nr:PDZ domain-containing protein [Planctomycetota bacterium]MBI3845940.1 PDZ domain-containing protein [Planctomycetota bacterium]
MRSNRWSSRSAALAIAVSTMATGCITVRRSAVEIHEPQEGMIVESDDSAPGPAGTKRTLNVGRGGILTVEEVTPKRKGWLGARLDDIDERNAKKRGLTPFDGVFVTSVESGSPAEMAGLLAGDIVQKLGAEPATSAGWLRFRIEQAAPDTTVALHVKRRAGEAAASETDVTVKLGGQTDDVRNVHSYQLRYLRDSKHLGCELGELTTELRKRYFGGEDSPALIVTDVTKLKPAHIGNLRELDLVRLVNGRDVRRLEDLRSILVALKGGEVLDVGIVRRGDSEKASVEAYDDIQKRTSFTIPILVSYDGEYRKTDFDLLLFLFGYESWDEWRDDGHEVDVRRCHDVGFLLDLIEYESDYDEKTFSLLWFIKFHSSRS